MTEDIPENDTLNLVLLVPASLPASEGWALGEVFTLTLFAELLTGSLLTAQTDGVCPAAEMESCSEGGEPPDHSCSVASRGGGRGGTAGHKQPPQMQALCRSLAFHKGLQGQEAWARRRATWTGRHSQQWLPLK